jgi:catechol 2,3-dioxygenase-like lactoylglutathione lyase family enzyme
LTRRTIATVALLVTDYDEAVAWFVQALGFEVRFDVGIADGKRWVCVAPGPGGAALLLARAATEEQLALVGNQGAGRVSMILETDDFARDHAAMRDRGVVFEEAPRHEPYGTVAVFRDLYGNRWDLLEPRNENPAA